MRAQQRSSRRQGGLHIEQTQPTMPTATGRACNTSPPTSRHACGLPLRGRLLHVPEGILVCAAAAGGAGVVVAAHAGEAGQVSAGKHQQQRVPIVEGKAAGRCRDRAPSHGIVGKEPAVGGRAEGT